jgi:hypothetical protein
LVVHHASNLFRCLFVDQKNATMIDGVVIENEADLAALIQSRAPEKIVSILPGSTTICRTSLLPDTDEVQLRSALRLQAEAKLLGGTPEHRRALATLACTAGESSSIGLIIAWPEETNTYIPEVLHDAFFIPATGAIAALFNGCRPKSPIVIADQSDGSVSLALTCPQGIAFRSTRENVASSEIFRQGVVRVVEETASLNNHSELYTAELVASLQQAMELCQDFVPMIMIPEEIQTSARLQLHGTSHEQSWWSTWGLAVGAAIAATGPLATLATMRFEAPVYNPSPAERFVASISQPKTALRLGIAAVLFLAIGPAIFSGMRLALLDFLNPNIELQYDESVSARKKQIVYSELTNSAWPMSKLIADVLNCTPKGIEIETMRLDVGEPISIRGRVIDADGHTAAELIAIMEEKLLSYRVFRDIKFSYDSAGTYGDRKFDISAVVMSPLKRPRYAQEDDFGTWTLAMRDDGLSPSDLDTSITEEPPLFDEHDSSLGSANVDSQPSAETPAYAGDREPREERARRPRTDEGSDASSRSSNRAAGVVASRLPEPLTAEQIHVMSLGEAKIALKDVSQGLSRVGSDSDAKKRLRNEMRMLLDRMKEVNKR